MSTLTGVLPLARLALRRDRVLLPVWLVTIAGLTAGVVRSLDALYASAQERAAGAAFGAANTVTRVFDGPASGTEPGAMAMVEAYLVLAILVALMSAQTVVRHTRQDEENGRAELLGAAAVGRHARLAAALLVALAANLVVAVAVAAVLAGNGLGLVGSAASGSALGVVGACFAAVAAVTAQLSGSQRGASALATVALAVAFLLRAVGDALGTVAPSGVELVSSWPSWLSPIGWGQQVRPFHQDNWQVFGLFGGLCVALVAAAFWLTSHRDQGAGLIATRPGPATASVRLRSPAGLAWRLQRGILLAWLVGLAGVGAAFGAIGTSADDLVGVSEQMRELITREAPGAALVDLYFAFIMGFLGVAGAGFTVQALLRTRTEEAGGRLEPVLATAVGRTRWLASYLVLAGLGTVAVFATTGAAAALAYGLSAGDLATGLALVPAALAQVPAALALGGLVVATFALLPRWTAVVGWTGLGASLVLGQLGEALELPRPVLNLSPFSHLPAVPAEPASAAPVLILLALTLALAGAGALGLRRRDLAISA
jgi:ABC-2 type transport system permease protein